jgi:uncharacterized protein
MEKKKVVYFIAAVLIISVITIFMPSFASASKTGHMILLATTEGADAKGSTADLYIEILPGSGRVYIDTFPLTKLDTQISTRFAKQVACDYLESDCSKYDFFYTIRSDSVIIGGPSAGAALTILTISVLDGWNIDAQTAITGTINSGGFIGSVGGIKEKLSAAHNAGIKRVLIPKGDAIKKVYAVTETNETGNDGVYNINRTDTTGQDVNITDKKEDMYKIAKELNLTLIEVASLDQAIYEFAGKKPKNVGIKITPDKDYSETMKGVNNILCARATELKGIAKPDNESKYEFGVNLTILGKNATEKEAYYSSASYCFRASIYFRWLTLIQEDQNTKKINQKIKDLKLQIEETNIKTDSYQTATLTDMQAKIIVHDRLVEAEDYLKDAKELLDKNNTDYALYSLAYAIERHYSAVVWSSFFGTGGRKIILDNESLKLSCTEKLSEAEERYQYVILYIPSALKNTRQSLDLAYADLKSGNYEYCLYKAARAKAESDLVLSVLGLNEDTIDEFIDIKIALIENVIAKEQKSGNFPILGFSYYEYAKNLRQQDKYSAQLFAEYALELSNLDMYFKKEPVQPRFEFNYQNTNLQGIYILIIGFILGFLVTFLFMHKTRKKDHNSIHIKIR